MPEFSGKSRFSRVYLPVYDDADSESPAYVDKDDVLFPFDASLHMLSIGHGPCVVVYADRVSYLFIQYIRQRTLWKVEHAETISWFRIYSSGDVDADVHYLLVVDFRSLYEVSDECTQFFQSFLCIFELVWYVHLDFHHIPLEIDQSDVYGKFLNVHSNEVSWFRVESV